MPANFYWQYLWSEWITEILLQFNVGYLIPKPFIHRSLVKGNYRSLASAYAFTGSRWSHSSKNVLGNIYVAGIEDPKKSFNLESKNLRTTLLSGLWIILLTSENAHFSHTMSWSRGLWKWGSATINGYELLYEHFAILLWTPLMYIIEHVHQLSRCVMEGIP